MPVGGTRSKGNLPALDSGSVVLCDRFSDSTFAYQEVAVGLIRRWCGPGFEGDRNVVAGPDPVASGSPRTSHPPPPRAKRRAGQSGDRFDDGGRIFERVESMSKLA